MITERMDGIVDKVLTELINMSRQAGSDARLTRGTGGNTSVKTPDGKNMYIKASGTALKDMTEDTGWRRVSIADLQAIVQDKSLPRDANIRQSIVTQRLVQACNDGLVTDKKPSVESLLHIMLGRYIIHLHPVEVSVLVCAKNGQQTVAKIFSDKRYPPLWVPYADLGYALARKAARLIGRYEKEYGRKPEIMFLEKHGLFVCSDSAEGALRLLRNVMKACSRHNAGLKPTTTRKAKKPAADTVANVKLNLRKAVFAVRGKRVVVDYYWNNIIADFLACRDAGKLLAVGPLAPEELLYTDGVALWLNNAEAKTITSRLHTLVKRGNKVPNAFVLDKLGLFIAGPVENRAVNADIALSSLYIRSKASRLGGLKPLTPRQQDFSVCHEGSPDTTNNKETIKTADRQSPSSCPMMIKGYISVVTGGGSGLGRSIAIGLARAGALVAVADIDINAANETVAIIKRELPATEAVAIYCNVTDEKSVDNAYSKLVNHWGGLDLLVNAAGVAPAYPLVNLPVDKWRFALEVNLTGYFLMARGAARIMIKQGMGGAIINISSKSGLEASKNNTPYNATKAGELHMARGWAMELGQYGIRVNCVCPGNVFEGSKIWNPAYIKQCAIKYGIKPEEVIPYYINKTILKREIKGQDIADAVVFLASERARTITGQIIVPDAGQVMVR